MIADTNTILDELTEALRQPFANPRELAQLVLPVVRRFADAQVAAERERITAAITRELDSLNEDGRRQINAIAYARTTGLHSGLTIAHRIIQGQP